MKCRIIQVEDYYKAQILVPCTAYGRSEEPIESTTWHDIYDEAKFRSVFAAKVALNEYVADLRRPRVIEEFEL